MALRVGERWVIEPDEPIAFMHIPGTAGDALHDLLKQHLREPFTYPATTYLDARHHITSQPSSSSSYRYIGGQFRFAELSLFTQRPPIVITLLREPVDRVLAHYRWLKTMLATPVNRAWLPPVDPALTLESFVFGADTRHYVENVQTHYLSDQHEFTSLPVLLDGLRQQTDQFMWQHQPTANLTRALDVLSQLPLVGIRERLRDTLRVMKYLFGWSLTMPLLPADPYRRDELTPPILKQILALNQDDIRLYTEATQQFEAQYQRTLDLLLDERASPFYTTPPPLREHLYFTFDEPVPGAGWYEPEYQPSTGRYCWSGPTRASTLDLPLNHGKPLRIRFNILSAMSPALLDGLALLVNEQPIALTRSDTPSGITFEGEIPATAWNAQSPHLTRLTFILPYTSAPSDRDTSSGDTRRLGIALNWVKLDPALTAALPAADNPVAEAVPAADQPTDAATDYWSGQFEQPQETFTPEIYWLALPAIQKRYQEKVTDGQADHWIAHVAATFFQTRKPIPQLLSLGCGTGELERSLAEIGLFAHCDAYDISPAGVEVARQKAAEQGITSITYHVGDMNHIELPAQHYDSVWFQMSLHHVEALESLCAQVWQTLKPDGLLIFDEYVGANYFGFSNRQQQAIRAAFDLIPPLYRRSFFAATRGSVQEHAALPDPAAVRHNDPSESVRASEILTIVQRYFDIVLQKSHGGTLLQFLLHGITGNFMHEDERATQILQMLFDIEDTLLDTDDLTSDFVLVVARPKALSTTAPSTTA